MPSAVWCSVMSVNHSSFAVSAANTCRVRPCSSTTAQRSSCTGGPGRRCLPRLGFPNALNQPLLDAIRHAVRSDIVSPASRASSASSRCPNSGSSRWASNNAFARYASTTSLGVMGVVQQSRRALGAVRRLLPVPADEFDDPALATVPHDGRILGGSDASRTGPTLPPVLGLSAVGDELLKRRVRVPCDSWPEHRRQPRHTSARGSAKRGKHVP